MTCNHCSTVSATSAKQAGAPEVEAYWAANRGHGQQCPQCGQFMSPAGGHSCPEWAVKQQAVETEAARLASALDVVLAEAGDAHRYHEPGALDRPALQTISDAIDLLEALPQALTAVRQQTVPILDTQPVKWRRPSWAGKLPTKPEDWAKVTDDQVEEWRRDTEECYQHNQAEVARRGGQRKAALNLLTTIYGKDSRQVKYFEKEKPSSPPVYDSFEFTRWVVRPREEARKKLIDAAKEQTRQTETKRLNQEAANWLLERGRKLGADFAYEDALETANDIAFYEEVARREEAGKAGEWYEFEGHNCDGNCDGWDGYSHRCQCGNRRVSWQMGYEHSFKNPIVYAEAH